MPTIIDLYEYIGSEYNDEIKNQMERDFLPYKILVCSEDYFYLENYILDTIRCVISDGKISLLKFN